MKAAIERALNAVGYDRTHLTRVIAYREIDHFLDSLACNRLDTLEISAGWKSRERPWGSFTEMNWPNPSYSSRLAKGLAGVA